MVKPKNWEQVNAIREEFWKEVFDDVNARFDEITQKTVALIDEQRKELQTLLLKKAHCYREVKRIKPNDRIPKYVLIIKYLDKCKDSERPVHIAQKLSISRDTIDRYLHALLSKGLLQGSKEKSRAVFYSKTKLWNVEEAIKAIKEYLIELNKPYAKSKEEKRNRHG